MPSPYKVGLSRMEQLRDLYERREEISAVIECLEQVERMRETRASRQLDDYLRLRSA